MKNELAAVSESTLSGKGKCLTKKQKAFLEEYLRQETDAIHIECGHLLGIANCTRPAAYQGISSAAIEPGPGGDHYG